MADKGRLLFKRREDMNGLKFIFLLLLGLLFLSACLPGAQGQLEGTPTPQPTPAAQVKAAPTSSPLLPTKGVAATLVLIPAAKAAQVALAGELNVSANQTEVVQVEDAVWPDGCLGLGKPDEMCMQVLISGFKVILRSGGKLYEYHTNQDGTNLRLAPTVSGDINK
jgi:hypothetical protein